MPEVPESRTPGLVVSLHAPGGESLPSELLERGVRLALCEEGVERAQLSITFLADAPILDMNRRWLQHDWVPDVLSFPLHLPGDPPLGDLYIGIDQAGRQGEEHGVPLEEELLRLTIHGTLHILGYDHAHDLGTGDAGGDEDSEGEILFELQESLVRRTLAGEVPVLAPHRGGI